MRIGTASSVFANLADIGKSKSISLPVKIKLCRSLVISTLAYCTAPSYGQFQSYRWNNWKQQVPTKTV